jgi:hypothetical protein
LAPLTRGSFFAPGRPRNAAREALCSVSEEREAASPADFRRLIADETEKWAKVIRAANIKPE